MFDPVEDVAVVLGRLLEMLLSYLYGRQPLIGNINALIINHIHVVSCPLRWHHIHIYLYNHKSYLRSLESGVNTFSLSHHMRLVLVNMSCLVESSGRTELHPRTLLIRGPLIRGNIFRRPVPVRQCA